MDFNRDLNEGIEEENELQRLGILIPFALFGVSLMWEFQNDMF